MTYATVVRADLIDFAVTGASGGTGTIADQQSGTVAQLKFGAVMDWLQRAYGAQRATALEAQMPSDPAQKFKFVEKFISDYQVGHVGTNRAQLEVKGHLDADALKRWVRVVEVKTRGGAAISSVFLFSSSIPGLSFSPIDTVVRIKESPTGQVLYSSLSAALQKFNVKLSLTTLQLSLLEPAKSDDEVRILKDTAARNGFNSALWMHLVPCKPCGGARLDGYFYNLSQGRILMRRGEDLAVTAADLGSAAKMKTVLKGPIEQFGSEFEDLISSGTLFSFQYAFTIDGIDAYRSRQQIENELGKLPYVVRLVPGGAFSKAMTYRLFTGLSAEELAQRVGQEPFNGFKLKPQRVDQKTIVVRYFK